MMLEQWQQIWDGEDGFRQTKLWFQSVNLKISKILLKSDRVTYGHLIQIITGHNYLNYHQFNMNRTNSSLCRYCEDEEETSWHYMASCQKYDATRPSITGHHDTPPSLLQLPAFINEGNIGCLLAPKG